MPVLQKIGCVYSLEDRFNTIKEFRLPNGVIKILDLVLSCQMGESCVLY